jgi:hypothetical protein
MVSSGYVVVTPSYRRECATAICNDLRVMATCVARAKQSLEGARRRYRI